MPRLNNDYMTKRIFVEGTCRSISVSPTVQGDNLLLVSEDLVDQA
jgi:hypothetical protein